VLIKKYRVLTNGEVNFVRMEEEANLLHMSLGLLDGEEAVILWVGLEEPSRNFVTVRYIVASPDTLSPRCEVDNCIGTVTTTSGKVYFVFLDR
jgi:hypothetical protein